MSEHEKVTKDIIPHAQMISMYIGQWLRVEKEYTEALALLRECREHLDYIALYYDQVNAQKESALQDKLDKFLGEENE